MSQKDNDFYLNANKNFVLFFSYTGLTIAVCVLQTLHYNCRLLFRQPALRQT